MISSQMAANVHKSIHDTPAYAQREDADPGTGHLQVQSPSQRLNTRNGIFNPTGGHLKPKLQVQPLHI